MFGVTVVLYFDIPVFVVVPFPCRPIVFAVPDRFVYPNQGFSAGPALDRHVLPERIKSRLNSCEN